MAGMPLQAFGNYMARNPQAMNQPVGAPSQSMGAPPQPNAAVVPSRVTNQIQPGANVIADRGRPAPQPMIPQPSMMRGGR